MSNTAAGDDQPERLPTAALAYKRVTYVNKMTEDSGSGAHTDITVWSPNLENGWFYRGAANDMNVAPDRRPRKRRPVKRHLLGIRLERRGLRKTERLRPLAQCPPRFGLRRHRVDSYQFRMEFPRFRAY
ncbi:hypothetical protein CPB85DRAFT_1444469 [Mucidula mucida]|nr:hypothetical protein CPB85DRAFT_1444469 [Mucidula mucida]